MEHITKSQIKLVRSLQQKKYRDQTGYFIAEGDKCIEELQKHFECVLKIDAHNATAQEIKQMSGLRTPQGSIAVFKKDRYADGIKTADADGIRTAGGLIVALDGVQDPGNLGTIIRTCDWYGISDIVCSSDTADCYNPKVVQATMGSLSRVRIHYTDLAEWLDTRRQEGEIDIYGTLLDGANMYDVIHSRFVQPHRACILIMGNEGNGISRPIRERITAPIRIPSYPEGSESAESLNVAIATAIVLSELRRPINRH